MMARRGRDPPQRPARGMGNCSAMVPSNLCDASHDVPIRRHNDCAQRKRLTVMVDAAPAESLPLCRTAPAPNDPTGGDRELRARMGRRHGNLMEVVGDVVAQLPLTLDFQQGKPARSTRGG